MRRAGTAGVSLALASVFGLRLFGMFVILPVLGSYAETLPRRRQPLRVGGRRDPGIYGLTQAILPDSLWLVVGSDWPQAGDVSGAQATVRWSGFYCCLLHPIFIVVTWGSCFAGRRCDFSCGDRAGTFFSPDTRRALYEIDGDDRFHHRCGYLRCLLVAAPWAQSVDWRAGHI